MVFQVFEWLQSTLKDDLWHSVGSVIQTGVDSPCKYKDIKEKIWHAPIVYVYVYESEKN